MVTKTETCSFSQFKIYPGTGRRFISRDGRLHYFFSHKTGAMYHQGIKRSYLAWTQEWRSKHKKIRVEDVQKRHTKKNVKVRKAIVGMSLDDINRKRGETRESRDKVLQEHEKKVKEQKKTQIAAKKEKKKAQAKTAPVAKAVRAPKVARAGKKWTQRQKNVTCKLLQNRSTLHFVTKKHMDNRHQVSLFPVWNSILLVLSCIDNLFASPILMYYYIYVLYTPNSHFVSAAFRSFY